MTKYISTRGRAPELDFEDAVLEGLARDGGLYVPETLPKLAGDVPASYVDVATTVTGIDPATVAEAYATFDHDDVCPVVQLDDRLWVQELWHGPTLAFKDLALQLVGRLMDAALARRGERRTIVVATSGDTGSAAIAACVGRTNLDIVVLHPAGRVSDVQRRQMTTVEEPNVHNLAVEGTFDDCQDLVKAMFADERFREELQLGAMNSINWGRILAQTPYYVTGQIAVGRECTFAVPTGNFGNVLSGWYARRMGAPIERFIIGSNRNDIITRWIATGALITEDVVPTISPAMDIQVSSNLERLLFELLDRDGPRTAELMLRFRELGSVEAPREPLLAAARLDDDETRDVIRATWDRYGYLVDPHTAVAIGAAERLRRDPTESIVCLSTAHPAKFPDAVAEATGVEPPVPERLAAALEGDEHYDLVGNDLAAVETSVRAAVTR
ncbi:MAG TPA: threonine synthase [Acidimicrobiales bacterium]|nr:threonine synthase [Acidimicrobiales bacterium]